MPYLPCRKEVLDRDFLGMRSRLIDLAATLDRIDRADGTIEDGPRVDRIRRSLEVLAGQGNSRAEQLQQIFSLPYDDHWMETYGVGKAP